MPYTHGTYIGASALVYNLEVAFRRRVRKIKQAIARFLSWLGRQVRGLFDKFKSHN